VGHDPSVCLCVGLSDRASPAPPGPLTVVIDAVDALASDMGSNSKTVLLLSSLLALVQGRPSPSRLVVHVNGSLLGEHIDVLPMLSSSKFSPTLVHVTTHPPILIQHLAEDYSTPPPPISTPEKFWSVFLPFSTRGAGSEAEKLVFGPDGDGTGGTEIVVDVLVRGANEGGGTARKVARGVSRTLEGWKNGAPCDVAELFSLASIFNRKLAVAEVCVDA
jgi:elongator complex protein 5